MMLYWWKDWRILIAAAFYDTLHGLSAMELVIEVASGRNQTHHMQNANWKTL